MLDLVEEVLSTFGFSKYEINLSTRPEKSVGDDAFWRIAEDALVEALGAKGWAYGVDEGGGAFYGPKIDIKIQDAIGRKWQCSTIQLDYNLPERWEWKWAGCRGHSGGGDTWQLPLVMRQLAALLIKWDRTTWRLMAGYGIVHVPTTITDIPCVTEFAHVLAFPQHPGLTWSMLTPRTRGGGPS